MPRYKASILITVTLVDLEEGDRRAAALIKITTRPHTIIPSTRTPRTDSKNMIKYLPSVPSDTALSAFVTSSAIAAQASHFGTIADGDPQPGAASGECQLLGQASIFIQGALGGLALLSLVYKRWRERPQRPLKIWFFDVSKQVVGSVLLHVANLLMSMLSSGQFTVTLKASNGEYSANPCSFYLLNLAIDVSLVRCWVISDHMVG